MKRDINIGTNFDINLPNLKSLILIYHILAEIYESTSCKSRRFIPNKHKFVVL